MDFFRKYYVPGIISLIFLPLIFIIKGYKLLDHTRLNGIELTMYTLLDSNRIDFNQLLIKPNKFLIIRNDPLLNLAALEEASLFLRIMRQSNQIAHISLELSDDMSMQEFVNLHDWIKSDSIESFIYVDKSLHCFSQKIKILQALPRFLCGNIIEDFVGIDVDRFAFWNNYLWKYGKQLIILYFLFIVAILVIKIKSVSS